MMSYDYVRYLAWFFASFALVGCGGELGDGSGDDGNSNLNQPSDGRLPPLAAIIIPTPAQTRSGSQTSQAACPTTEAYDATLAIIDEENAALAGDIELVQATLAATPVETVGIFTYEAEVDGRTLTIEVVQDPDEGFVYTGTLVDGEGESHDYLSGAMLTDQSEGALVVSRPEGDELNVAWQKEAETLKFARVLGSRSTAYDESPEEAKIVAGEVIVWWSKEDFAGVVVNTDAFLLPKCFEGDASSDDFCDAECSDDVMAKITE